MAEIQARRRAIWDRYASELRDWAAAHGITIPTVPPYAAHPAHLFALLMPSAAARTALIEHLGARGILAVFHYIPLHLSPMGQRFGGAPGDCPVTEDISERLVRLPFYSDLTRDEQTNVIETVTSFIPIAV